MYPVVALELSQVYARNDGVNYSDNTLGIGATLNLNLFHFGSDLALIKAASASELSAKSALESAILTAEEDAVQVLTQFIGTALELNAGKRFVESTKQAIPVMEQRLDRGLVSKIEAEKLAIDFGNIQATYSDTQVRFSDASAALKIALGTDNIEKSWPWKNSFFDSDFKYPNIEKLLRQRPDWQSAEKAVEAAEFLAKSSWGKILPSIDFKATGGYQNQVARYYSQPVWSAGLYITFPLFDHLVRASEYEALIHEKGVAQATLETVRRKARLQYSVAQLDLEIAKDVLKDREINLEKARNVIQSTFRKLYAGTADVNALVIDQKRWYDVEYFNIRGWRDAHRLYSGYCHALGLRIADCHPPTRKIHTKDQPQLN
jgi:outer membrane protein TolC